MRTILVVDDDADIRDLLEVVLEDAGYRVLTACNGREALGTLHAEHPSAVVLDLIMPVMDGFQLRAAMLEEPELASIPIVVLSGATEAETLAISPTPVLAKPLRLADLLDAIARVAA